MSDPAMRLILEQMQKDTSAQQTLKESCDSTEDPEADGCESDSQPVMTCSSTPSLRPHVERGAGTTARSTEQKEDQGRQANSVSLCFYRPRWKIQKLILANSCSCCLWALPAHAWSFPCPPVTVSAALPWLVIFYLGQWACMGRGECSSQPQVPTVFIHIVNSTSSSPIKQASQA